MRTPPKKSIKFSVKPKRAPKPLVLTHYRTKFDAQVIALAKKGKFKVQWASKIGVCERTLDRWASENPSFADAVEMAFTHLKAFWLEKASLMASRASKGNPTVMKFILEAGFGMTVKDPERPLQVSGTSDESLPAIVCVPVAGAEIPVEFKELKSVVVEAVDG